MFETFSTESRGISQSLGEVLELQQITQDFHREVQYREDFEQYCQWYYQTAESHRQELEAMQGDINLLSWFGKRFWRLSIVLFISIDYNLAEIYSLQVGIAMC